MENRVAGKVPHILRLALASHLRRRVAGEGPPQSSKPTPMYRDDPLSGRATAPLRFLRPSDPDNPGAMRSEPPDTRRLLPYRSSRGAFDPESARGRIAPSTYQGAPPQVPALPGTQRRKPALDAPPSASCGHVLYRRYRVVVLWCPRRPSVQHSRDRSGKDPAVRGKSVVQCPCACREHVRDDSYRRQQPRHSSQWRSKEFRAQSAGSALADPALRSRPLSRAGQVPCRNSPPPPHLLHALSRAARLPAST